MKSIIISCLAFLTFVCHVNAQVIPDAKPDEKISILLGHRYSGGFNPHDYEQYSFAGLFKINGKYYLKPTKVKIAATVDKCSLDSIFTISAVEKGECRFFFWGITKYPTKGINTVALTTEHQYLQPNDTYTFNFDNGQYSFLAEGETDGDNVKNYKLIYLDKKTNKQQVIVEEELLEKSKVEILFVGDLDGDNKPDFIINAPPNSETRNVLLFMSSFAEDGQLANCVAQQFDWFDC